jgi:hypothetical protein
MTIILKDVSGFADWVFEDRWYDKNEYIVARLKDLI